MMKKTSAKQFRAFKEECLRLQSLLGLTQYRLSFDLKKLDNRYAEITMDENASAATIRLDSEWDAQDDECDPIRSARHEMIHLMLHRLGWLGSCRYLDDCEIPQEDEKVTHKLTALLSEI